MYLAKNHLSDTGVTDLDMDPDFETIFFHVSALPCNLKAAITVYAAILKYKHLKFNTLLKKMQEFCQEFLPE